MKYFSSYKCVHSSVPERLGAKVKKKPQQNNQKNPRNSSH